MVCMHLFVEVGGSWRVEKLKKINIIQSKKSDSLKYAHDSHGKRWEEGAEGVVGPVGSVGYLHLNSYCKRQQRSLLRFQFN